MRNILFIFVLFICVVFITYKKYTQSQIISNYNTVLCDTSSCDKPLDFYPCSSLPLNEDKLSKLPTSIPDVSQEVRIEDFDSRIHDIPPCASPGDGGKIISFRVLPTPEQWALPPFPNLPDSPGMWEVTETMYDGVPNPNAKPVLMAVYWKDGVLVGRNKNAEGAVKDWYRPYQDRYKLVWGKKVSDKVVFPKPVKDFAEEYPLTWEMVYEADRKTKEYEAKKRLEQNR